MTARVICVGLAIAGLGYAAGRWYARRRARRLIESWPVRRRQMLVEAAEAFAQAPPEP